MLYVHSFGLIEQNIYNHLQSKQSIVQLDAKSDMDFSSFSSNIHVSEEVLVYSFLQMEHYKFSDSFALETKRISVLLDFVQQQKFKKLILITYPGAFVNADNLFLRHKGIIEKMFCDTGIPVTYFHTQAVVNPYQKVHNLHAIFYNKVENALIIPKKSSLQIYAISINHLVDLIHEASTGNQVGHFDAFDEILHLKTFLSLYSPSVNLQSILPTYLYFKSYLGQYSSSVMLELFLRITTPMYSFRTEKMFGIKLNSTKPMVHGYFENQDYHASPVFGTKGFQLST
jgi:hypothetical protein